MNTGGCLCGAVRYEAAPRLDTGYYCHCRDCQIGSSSAFSVAVLVAEQDFRLTAGTLATWSKTADSGKRIDRGFCPVCGTPLLWTGEGFPGEVVLSVSSLDDPESVQPDCQLWTDRALSWCRIREGLESFAEQP